MLKNYKYSLVIFIIICYLSLSSSSGFDRLNIFHFRHMDKIVHICMYFGLMSVLILETYIIGKKKYSIVALALIPFFLGITTEMLQGLLTTTRSADVYDAISNALGVLFSVALWLIIKSVYREKFK